jgi:hypothetical protein
LRFLEFFAGNVEPGVGCRSGGVKGCLKKRLLDIARLQVMG